MLQPEPGRPKTTEQEDIVSWKKKYEVKLQTEHFSGTNYTLEPGQDIAKRRVSHGIDAIDQIEGVDDRPKRRLI